MFLKLLNFFQQNDPWEWDDLEAYDETKKRKNNTCDSTQQVPED